MSSHKTIEIELGDELRDRVSARLSLARWLDATYPQYATPQVTLSREPSQQSSVGGTICGERSKNESRP